MKEKKALRMDKVMMVAAALLVTLSLFSYSAMAVTLSACGTLNSPNTTYVLDMDIGTSLTTTCLTVAANNITIDCAGYTIAHAQAGIGHGVRSTYNLTTVKGCKFDDGVAGYTNNEYYAIYYYNSAKNGTIFNNTFLPSAYLSRPIRLLNSDFNNISNNKMKTSTQNGNCINIENSDRNIISRNNMTTTTLSALGIYLLGGSSFNIISYNNVSITSYYGIFLSSSPNNILVGNRVRTPSAVSYAVQGTSSSHFNQSIDATNLAEGSPVNYTYNRNGLVINNVNFTKYGQVMFAWCRNITITKSNFSKDSLSLFYTNMSNISGNRIVSSTGPGIYAFYYSKNNSIKGNTISASGNGGDGISLDHYSSFNDISNNTVTTTGAGASGIYLYYSSSSNSVKGNRISASGTNVPHGIYVYSSSNFNKVDENIITTSTAYGIYLDRCRNNTVRNNVIKTSGLGAYGIAFLSSQNNTLTDNKMNTTNSLGFMFFKYGEHSYGNSIGGSNLVEGMPINYTYGCKGFLFKNTNFTRYGQVIYYSCTNLTIQSSNFSQDSLSIFNTKNSSFSGNYFNASKGFGINLAMGSSSNSFSGNRVATYNDYCYGFLLDTESMNNNITGNVITTKGTQAYGILLYSPLTGNRIMDNIINTSSATGYGISLQNSPSYSIIDNNTINTLGGGMGINLYNQAGRNTISNNRVRISVGSALISGIRLITQCSNNVIINNSIITPENYGLRLEDTSNNNIISNNNIWTYSSSLIAGHGQGISISNSVNNSFSHIYVSTNGTNAYAFFVEGASVSFTISDSMLNASHPTTPEFYVQNTLTSGTWNFTNVTRSNKRPIDITWTSGSNGRLNMHWYLDVRARNSSANLQSALVKSYNNKSVQVFSESTSSNGMIAKKTLIEYSTVGPNAKNYTRYSPYNISISLAGYPVYINRSVNMSNNRFLDINLACFCPIGQDWPVRDYCHMTNSICNMPDYRVTCLSSGRIIMSSYTIIAKKAITPINHGCLLMDNRSRLLIAD